MTRCAVCERVVHFDELSECEKCRLVACMECIREHECPGAVQDPPAPSEVLVEVEG